MTELNKQIEYLFKLVDNVSSSASQMAQSLDEAGNRIDANLARQDEMRSSVRRTGEALDDQRVRADDAASGVRGSLEDIGRSVSEMDDILTGGRSAQEDMIRLTGELSDDLDVQRSRIEQTSGRMRDSLDGISQSAEGVGNSIDTLNIRQEEVSAGAERLSDVLDGIGADMDGFARRSDSLDQRVGRSDDVLNNHRSRAESVAEDVRRSVSDMEQTLDDAGRYIDSMMDRQDELDVRVDRTSEILDTQRGRASSASASVRGSVSDMELALDELDASTDVSLSKQAELRSSMQDTQDSAMANQVSVLTQLTAVMGLKEGLSAVTGGMISLGLVSDDTAKSLGMVNSAFSMMAGAVSMIKSVQAVMTTLNTTSAIGASIDAFRATLTNPAMLGVVALAGGAALGVAGAYLMTNNTTNNNQTTVNIVDTTPVAAQSEILQVVTGGAL